MKVAPKLGFIAPFYSLSQNDPISSIHNAPNPRMKTSLFHKRLSTDEKLARNMASSSIYIHIPYCRKRCHYCDFAIMPIGNVDTEHSSSKFKSLDEKYCNTIIDEIALSTGIVHSMKNQTDTPNLNTVYFGGGTPSLAPESTLRAIMEALNETYGINGINQHTKESNNVKPEITIEMDPGTFTKSKLHSLFQMGFNRISLGVQSFHDPTLKRIGRVHRKKDILDTIQMIREEEQEYGYDVDLSIDLISGLPGVSLAQWVETLEFAVDVINPEHMSIYDLQVEEGTKFGKWYDNVDNEDEDDDCGPMDATYDVKAPASIEKSINSLNKGGFIQPLPRASDCAFMYRYADGYLKSKGYEHYEISSYAKKGKRAKHNSNYWDIGSEWYAVGLGATSCFNGVRYARPRKFADYIDWVQNQISLGNLLPKYHEREYNEDSVEANREDDEDEKLAEIVMTRLRTSDGLDLSWVEESYGKEKLEAILRGLDLGLDLKLATLDIDSNVAKLTSPDGFLFSNSILSNVFAELN